MLGERLPRLLEQPPNATNEQEAYRSTTGELVVLGAAMPTARAGLRNFEFGPR